MKSSPFRYLRPWSLADAVGVLASSEDAKVLAGGQSLIASLNMRLSAPSLLVDINAIDALNGIDAHNGVVRVGALARHREVLVSPLIRDALPLVAAAMEHVAHPAIRARGTLCGSLAYADPAAEMPACAVALDATLVLAGSSGTRAVRARDFFRGLYETDCRPDEILIEVLWPMRRAHERFGFGEVALRRGDFPAVGVTARALVEGGRLRCLEVVVFGSEANPLLCTELPGGAEGSRWSGDLRDAVVAAVLARMDPMDNQQGGPQVKRRQARTLLGRVLDRMMEGAGDVG